MPLAFPSLRIDRKNPLHHLWCNNGTWWLHYTLHFGHRKRRIRRSLETKSIAEAVSRRDELLARLEVHGQFVADRRPTDDAEPTEVPA